MMNFQRRTVDGPADQRTAHAAPFSTEHGPADQRTAHAAPFSTEHGPADQRTAHAAPFSTEHGQIDYFPLCFSFFHFVYICVH
jgi:hypothetical protein